MSKEKDIEKAVQRLAGTYLKDIVSIYVCNVDSVDKNNRMCDCSPISGDAISKIPGVQLCAENSDGLVVYPSVGSTVIVALSTRNNAFILFTSEIDEIVFYKAVSNKGYYYDFNIDGNGTQQFNGDTYGGLPIVKDTDDSNNGILKKLNNLENLVNGFINLYNAHTHPYVNVTSPATTSPTTSLETNTLTPTSEGEITNKYIKQGKPLDIP